MDAAQFKKILTTFADSPADLDLAKGRLLVQIRDEVIEARVTVREGELRVVESDVDLSATRWLIQRVARIDLLASRILAHVHEEKNFVYPSGELVDQIEMAPEPAPSPVDDAISSLQSILNRRPAGASAVLYLTSYAGEGKTTLINQLARAQAEAYKKKATDWLLLPVGLGGRPFLRFDEVVVAALLNRFRFQHLYFESFIELVKLGVIVPALDGFEEMFVEGGTGEAVSALGGLMTSLQSSGTLLIAARKAVFEHKSLETQARMLDALNSLSVTFARLGLRRWEKRHFVAYCGKRNVGDGEDIYNDVCQRLNPDHPVLTRAVLVRRLLDVAARFGDRAALIEQLASAPQDFFAQFVDTILEREANEKWIDRSGEPAKPLLSVAQHHELLSIVAQEMWTTRVSTLRGDLMDVLSELFCDRHRIIATVARQVPERLRDHALLTKSELLHDHFVFDHEEFYHFFLGEALGRLLEDGHPAPIRDVLRIAPIPPMALDMAILFALKPGKPRHEILERLKSACAGEGPASFSRENGGGLAIRLLSDADARYEVEDLTFPPDALASRKLKNIIFKRCYFQPTSLSHTILQHCNFDECSFERIELDPSAKIQKTMLLQCDPNCVVPADGDLAIFNPAVVRSQLKQSGFDFREESAPQVIGPLPKPDESFALAQKALRAFLRNTEINEETLRCWMGQKAPVFMSKILPELIKRGAIREVQYRGHSSQRGYSLGRKLSDLTNAIGKSEGNYERLLDELEEFQ